LVCVAVAAAIVVPAARAQRSAVDRRTRDARTAAQQKIDPRVMTAIYHRRGDARGRVVVSAAPDVRVDRHGRAFVDVRAPVAPALEKKVKALGGVVTSTSRPYDSIVGWVPLLTLERLAADPTVRAIVPGQ
jgi:hypothetical protein